MKNKNISFTAASTLPIKLLLDTKLITRIRNHQIIPTHIQINPTNQCNMNCSFCSCKNRNKSSELTLDKIKKTIVKYRSLGTKAVTITGGGDPLLFTHLNDLLEFLIRLNIKIGFVTNGIAFEKVNPNLFSNITWCRISLSDEHKLNLNTLIPLLKLPVDWSFSYVLTDSVKPDKLVEAIKFANTYNFTHVRLVTDILNDGDSIGNIMDIVKDRLKYEGVNDSLVIYQGRKNYSPGHTKCLISLLKPNIDAEGNILPCCGIQYALKNASLDFDKNCIMGQIKDIEKIYSEQQYFNGSICKKCYYAEYNSILNILWDGDKIKHKEFI